MGLVIIGHDTETQAPVTLGDLERRAGLYVLGRPGTGKTTLLVNLSLHDIEAGHGLFFLDPHGDAIIDLLARCGPERLPTDCILLRPDHELYTFGLNLTACRDAASLTERITTYTRAYNVFYKVFGAEWGPWLQLILQNTLYAFIENQDYTLAEAPQFLLNADFRAHVVGNMRHNLEVVDFWRARFGSLRESDQQAQIAFALTRLSTLLGHPYIRDIIGQKRTTLDFSDLMEHRKILLVHFSANLALDIKRFIGTMLVSGLLHATRARPIGNRPQFSIVVDEFQNFATEDFAILSTEGRKYGVACAFAHQERQGQLRDNPQVIGATAAAASKVFFQPTVPDAQEHAPEFARLVAETKPSREAELAPSPHAIEDIWERGHPFLPVMQVRDTCFWLVDLLKQPPQDRHYKFELFRFSGLHFDHYNWDYYRATPEMVKLGLTLLNQYYYNLMIDQFYLDIDCIALIQNLGGLFGFYPAMRPVLTDEKRVELAAAIKPFRDYLPTSAFTYWDRITRRNVIEIKRLQPGDHAEHHPSPWQLTRSMQLAIWGKRPAMPGEAYELKRKIAAKIIGCWNTNVPHTPIEVMPEHIPARPVNIQDMEDWLSIARICQMHPNAVETLYEWELTPLPDAHKELFLRFFENAGKENEECKKAASKALIERFYRPDNYSDHARAEWQITQLADFRSYLIIWMHTALSMHPVKLPSARYDETMRVERTQQDLVNEMAQELIDLPRYTAYAKVITEQARVQQTVKRKIRTQPLPPPLRSVSPGNLEEWTMPPSRYFCKARADVAEEIAARLAPWTQHRSCPRRDEKLPDEPPPASY